MKKLILTMIACVATGPAIYGQAYFNFNNLYGNGIITIAGSGNYPGSDYNVSLFYELGNVSGNPDPSTLLLLASESAVSFLGTTGGPPTHGPTADGAGTFDGGGAVFPSTGDGTLISVEAAVWYAGAGATSYAQAAAQGNGVGHSALVPITLVSGTDANVMDLSAMNSFIVGSGVPEPTAIALGALGGATLFLLRRRK